MSSFAYAVQARANFRPELAVDELCFQMYESTSRMSQGLEDLCRHIFNSLDENTIPKVLEQ